MRAMVTRPSQLGGPISFAVHAASEIAPGWMTRARNLAYRYSPPQHPAPAHARSRTGVGTEYSSFANAKPRVGWGTPRGALTIDMG